MGAGAERLVVLDRDGVINVDSGDYIKSPEEWIALPGSLEAIAALGRAGYRVFVVSNQSGLARGLFSADTLERIEAKMLAEVGAAGGRIERIYVCPHLPSAGCDCRKPQPGLLRRLEREFAVSLAGVAVIGDKQSDLDAARAVGARPILVRTGYGERTLAALDAHDLEVYADLAAAVAGLLSEPVA